MVIMLPGSLKTEVMAAISQNYIDVALGNIETLQGRFANELCNLLKRHSGDLNIFYELVGVNNTIGKIIGILQDYVPVGNSVINDASNGLTETEINSLINYAYRVLNKYSNNIFLPTDPNIYP
jgi:hypothetical protein